MRRSQCEIRDPAVVEDILERNTHLHLAMSDGGEPYVLPLSYGWRGGVLWIHSATEGRKLDVIRAEPRVAFSVVDRVETVREGLPCSWGTRYASVVGTGIARIVEDGPELLEGLSVLVERHGGDPAQLPASPGGVVVIRVEVATLSGKASEG